MMKIFKIFFTLHLVFANIVFAETAKKDKLNVTVDFDKEKNEKTVKGDETTAAYVVKTIIGTGCSDEKIYFKVGDQVFAAKQDEIDLNRSILKEIQISIDKYSNEYEYTIRGDLGCKNAPAPFVTLAVKNGNFSPILFLEDSVGYQPTLSYIKHLNENKLCKTTSQPLLISCAGSKTVNGEKISVVFLMPISNENSWYTERSEMPIHARCEFDSKSNSICAADEYFKKNVKGSALLSPKKISKDDIFGVRNNMMEIFRKFTFD